MDKIEYGITAVKHSVNNKLSNREPWQIVALTTTTVLAASWIWGFIFQDESLVERAKKAAFSVVKRIPAVAKKIDSEMKTLKKNFEDDVIKRNKGQEYIVDLPKTGIKREDIIKKVKDYIALGDYNWKDGSVSGTVYHHSEELITLLTEVYSLASYTNPLHSDVFPGICKMEAEVVRMCANLFHGGPDACGTMTTGGTESIIMACKAYRDYAKSNWNITKPEIVLPVTAHPAFDKAASYFKMKTVRVPVVAETMKVDTRAMARSISRNTCMLVGSVPNYPYGTADDIEAIAALGRKYKIPVHVDCCLGGFLTAFMPLAGYPVPRFDFSLPGVTSISADTHKYGFAPKGSSVVLYSEAKYRMHQFCVSPDWPGGVYGSPTVNGSRAGGIIAACWATLVYFGLEGYVGATRRIMKATKQIENGLRKIEDIFVFGSPLTSVVAIGSNKFHIYLLSEALISKGWNLHPLQFPPGLHICVTDMHTQPGVTERFISDIKESVEIIMKNPTEKVMGKMAVYGMAQGIPDRTVVGDFTRLFICSTYYTPQKKAQQPTLNGYNNTHQQNTH